MQEFGRYQLMSRIGAGGMAEVFLARSFGAEGLEKQVVIKRIRPEYAKKPRFVSMFIDEAKIAVSLNHPNVAQVYEFGRVGADFYIAMEYVEGEDLARLQMASRRARAPFPVADAIYIGIELSKALDYAHRKRDPFDRPLEIVHRDVSPQNILVSREGSVKLLDFGIAKAAGVGELETEIKGKFSYMSPEQARGDQVDGRSDLFSLGIVLWELIAGQPLFPYSTGKETLELVKNAVVPDIRQVRPEVDGPLVEILGQALSRRAEDRFDNARELQVALTRCLFSTGTIADSVTLAGFVSRLGPALREEPEEPSTAQLSGGLGHRTAAPGTQVPALDTSDRLLDQIVSDGSLDSHITDVPAPTQPPMSATGTAITLRDAPVTLPPPRTLVQTERKEIVVVCGDLRGFSTLRGNSPYERWHHVLMDTIRIVEAIAYKNDALVDRLGETGFTLVLGLPVTSENDAERAVAMGRDLIEAVEAMNINLESPLQLSLGLVVGSAVIDHEVIHGATTTGGQKFEWTYDHEEAGRGGLYLAEALARAAMPRELLLGGRLLRRIQRHYRTEPVDRIQVDLDTDEIEIAAHRLKGPKSGREQMRELRHAYQTLFGRDLSLKNLRDAYRNARLKGRTQALLLTGEQGVGKSTLVNEFLSGLSARGRTAEVLIIRGVADLFDKDTAYGSLASLLLEVLRLQRGADLRVANERLGMLEQAILMDLNELDRRFVVHSLAFLVGIKVQGNVVEHLEPDARKAALHRSLQLFVRAMASRQPLILALEDIQNIDASTLSFLVELLEEGLDASAFLLMTGLPMDEAAEPWARLLRCPLLTVEPLGELDPGGARALTEALLPEHLAEDGDLVTAIIARAGGNPLYIKELVELIIERGLQHAREVTLQLEATDEEPAWIPTTVEGLLASRIDRLPPEARKTLQRCGLFGLTFAEPLVQAVLADTGSPGGLDAVFDHLRLLVDRGFLRRLNPAGAEVEEPSQIQASHAELPTLPRRRRQDQRLSDALGGATRTSTEQAWAFPNTVVMEVAARGMVEPERSILHQRIADHLLDQHEDLFQLDVVNIAHNLDAAGQPEQAGELYLVAAHQALGSVGGDECLRLVNKALDRIEPGTDHCRSALDLKERALAILGRPEERREILEQLLDLATSTRRRLQVHMRMLRLEYERGHLDEVAVAARELLEEARACDVPQVIGSVLRLLHMVYRDTGRHQQALDHIEEAITLFRAEGDIEGLWAATVSKGITLRQGGRLEEALEAYQSSLTIIEGKGYRRQEQTTRTNLGLLYVNLGQLDLARENYEQALQTVRALGFIRDEAALLANLGHLQMLYGDYNQAHRTLVLSVRLARRSRDRMALTDALITLGFVHHMRGRLRESSSLLEKGLRLARDIHNVYLITHALLGMARVAIDEGDPASLEQAIAHAREAEAVCQEASLDWGRARALSLQALALHRKGHPDEAIAHSQRAVHLLGEQGYEAAEHILARHAAIVAEADPEAARAAHRRARALVRATCQRLDSPEARERFLAAPHNRQVLDGITAPDKP